jgi:hypothetical protein
VLSASVSVESDYLGQTSGSGSGLFLLPTQDLQWFVDNIGPGGDLGGQGSVVFADQSSAPITVAYATNVSGIDVIVIQIPSNTTMSYPATLYGTRNVQRTANSLDIKVSDENDVYQLWQFNDNGVLSGPAEGYLPVYGIANSPGGSLDIVSFENSININSATDINIGSMAVPAALNISTYLGAYINSARTAEYSDEDKSVATLGDVNEVVASAEPVETPYSVVGGTTGGTNQPTFNGDPLFDASYVEHGPLVYFRINVDFSNITDFGNGQYFMTLPFPAKYDVFMREGHIFDASTGKSYGISAHVEAGAAVMLLSATSSNGLDVEFTYNTPITLTTEDHFHISGTYIKETA